MLEEDDTESSGLSGATSRRSTKNISSPANTLSSSVPGVRTEVAHGKTSSASSWQVFYPEFAFDLVSGGSHSHEKMRLE